MCNHISNLITYSKYHGNLLMGFWAMMLKFGHHHYFGYWLSVISNSSYTTATLSVPFIYRLSVDLAQ